VALFRTAESSAGKTFHPNRPMNNDLPLSWTSYDRH
jgi:hypothetical protein